MIDLMGLDQLVSNLSGLGITGKVGALKLAGHELSRAVFQGKGTYAANVDTDNRPGLREIRIDMNDNGKFGDRADLRVIEQNPHKLAANGQLTSTAKLAVKGAKILNIYQGGHIYPSGQIVNGEFTKVPSVLADALGI